MASKVTLINLAKVDSTITNDLNTNFTRLADAIDDALDRTGASPNTLEDDVDANDFQIKNLGKPTLGNHALRLADITDDAKTAKATAVSVEDTGGNFSSDNVEGALEEIDNVKIVDSVSDLQSGSFESGVERIWLSGYYGVGTAGGRPLYRDPDDTTTADNGSTVFVDADGVRWKQPDTGLDPEHATDSGTDAFVSSVHTGTPNDGATITRDFQSENTTTSPTLDGKTITDRDQTVLWPGALSGERKIKYDSGSDTYIVLDPVMVLSSAFSVRVPEDYADYQAALDDLSKLVFKTGGKVDIIASSGFSPSTQINLQSGGVYNQFTISSVDSVLTVDGSWDAGDSFMYCRDTGPPRLNTLVDMQGLGVHGVNVGGGGYMRVTAGSGVKNAGQRGAEIFNIVCNAEDTVWDGAGTRGVRVGNAGVGRFRGASAKNCGTEGFAISASIANCQNGDASGCETGLNAESAASVQAGGIDVSNCDLRGILAANNAQVRSDGMDISGDYSEAAVEALQGASVAVGSSSIDAGSGQIFRAADSASIDAPGCTNLESTINPIAILATNGARINLDSSAMLLNNSGEISNARGSFVNARGITGTFVFRNTTNTLSNQGAIFED